MGGVIRLLGARIGLAAVFVLSAPLAADEPAKQHVEKYASRLFLADGRVVDVVGTSTIAIPSGETSDIVSLRMPSGRILQASSRSERVWDTFELQLASGDVTLTLRGTMGFGIHDKLPDGLMLRLKGTTYRWLAYPTGTRSEGSSAKKTMQSAVEKLPQDFLADLAVFAGLPAAGLDSSVLGLSPLYMGLTEILSEGWTPVNVTSTQKLEPEVAAKLLAGK